MIDFNLAGPVENGGAGVLNGTSSDTPTGGAFDEMLARSLGRGVVKGYSPAPSISGEQGGSDGRAAADGFTNTTAQTAALTTLVGSALVESGSPALTSDGSRLVGDKATRQPGIERPIDRLGLPTPLAAGVTLTSKRRVPDGAVQVARASKPTVEVGDAALRIPVVASPADPLATFAVTDVAGTSGAGSVVWDVKISSGAPVVAPAPSAPLTDALQATDPASLVDSSVERPVEKIGLPPPEQNPRASTPVAIDLGAASPAVLDPTIVVDVRVPVRTIPEQPNTSSPQPSTQGSGLSPAEATASFDIANPQSVGVESPPERSLPTPPGGTDNGSTGPTSTASTLLGRETARVGRRGTVDRPVKGRPVVGPLDQVAGAPTDMSQVASSRATSSVDVIPASSPSVPGSATAVTVDRIMEAIEVQRAGPQPDAVLVDIPEMDGLRLRVALRGTEVAITRTSIQGSTENIRPMLIELGSALANKGFSLAGERRGGGQNGQPERPYTPESDQRHQRRRSVNRRGIQL